MQIRSKIVYNWINVYHSATEYRFCLIGYEVNAGFIKHSKIDVKSFQLNQKEKNLN